MATVTPRSASREGVESLTVREWGAGDGEASHSDRYLAARLAAATADYKGVALTTFLLGAGVGVLVWLAIGILAEHWLVAGGLPRWLRWTWLACGFAALAAAALRWLVPLVRYRVNLVYAARQIEREHPELHNDLVNTVLVKARPDASPAVVVTSLKRRTARRLADVAGSATMDRTHAVRLAYALLAAVGLACLYEVVAPKSLLVSAARLVAPWIGWAAPSRVRIDGPRLAWRLPDQVDAVAGADGRRRVAIDGGRAVVIRGRQLEVTAAIRGLRAGEQPVCRVTPLTDAGGIDPQATPWQVVMHSGPDADPAGRLFTALLPDAGRGLDRSLDVSIVGGDAHTEPVRVTVVDAPSLLVREVRYDFPAYTKRPPETVAWQGDLRAVEETLVTLSVEANQPLEAAWVDFRGDGQRDLKIKLSGSGNRQGTVSFPLRLNAERMAAEHPTYRLVFQGAGAAGGRDGVVQDSLVHRIEVVADIAPEIAIEEPTDSPRRVPPGSPVLVRVRASDPDFGLARVGIETRIKGGGHVTPVVLLDEPREGVFKGSGRLVPDKLGAGAGSVLEYRGFAIDTRPQQTNVAHTPWQELQIDAAAKPQPQPADQPGIPDEPRRGGDRQEPGDRDGGAGRDGGAPRDRAPRDGNARDPGAEDGQAGDPRDAGGKNGDRGGATEPTAREADRDRQQDPGRGQPRDREPGREPQGQPADQRGEGGGGEGQQAGDRGAGEGNGQQPNQGRDQQGGRGGRQGQPRDGQDGGRSTESDNATGDDAGSSAGAADGGDGDRRQRQGGGNRSDGAQNGERGEPADAEAAGEEGGGAPGEGESRDDGRTSGGGRERTGPGRGRGRVAADGTDDGEAMERILADRQQKGEQGDTADGSRADAGRPGAQAGDRGEASQQRPDDSAQSRDGDPAPRQQGDSTSTDRGRPSDGGERGDSAESSSTTDGGKAGGERGRQGGRDGDRDQGTRDDGTRDDGSPPRGQDGGQTGNDPRTAAGQKNGGGQQSEGDRQPSDQGIDRDSGEKDTGARPEANDTGSPGRSSEGGEGNAGREQQGAGGRDTAQQRADDRGSGERGAGEQGAGEKGGGQEADAARGVDAQAGSEKGGGEKAGGEKGGGEKGGGERASGQEGEGQRGGAKGGGAKGDRQQPDGSASEQPAGSEDGSGHPDQGQERGEGGSDQPADAAGAGGKRGAGGKPSAGKGGTSGKQPGAPGPEGDDASDGEPPTGAADPGPQQEGNTGQGGWARSDGAADPQKGAVDGPAPTAETEWGRQDVDHARNAADLAIEHLRRSMEKGDASVLDSLGWTKDDARAFLNRWQALKEQAEAGDPVKRREFERTLRSLGLRGGDVRSRRDVPADVKGGQAEGRRSRPPSEYRDRFKAYTQGTTSE